MASFFKCCDNYRMRSDGGKYCDSRGSYKKKRSNGKCCAFRGKCRIKQSITKSDHDNYQTSEKCVMCGMFCLCGESKHSRRFQGNCQKTQRIKNNVICKSLSIANLVRYCGHKTKSICRPQTHLLHPVPFDGKNSFDLEESFESKCRGLLFTNNSPLSRSFTPSRRFSSRVAGIARSSAPSQKLTTPFTSSESLFNTLQKLLAILCLLRAVGAVEQINSITSENHFLENELPAVDVVGVEGGEGRIPCDVTPPTSRDTPILILISRGTTPLYSVDARSGSASSSVHWINREVLGDRAQFQMPKLLTRFRDQDFYKFTFSSDTNNPLFSLNEAQYSLYNSIRENDSNDKEKDDVFDFHTNRRKTSKVLRQVHVRKNTWSDSLHDFSKFDDIHTSNESENAKLSAVKNLNKANNRKIALNRSKRKSNVNKLKKISEVDKPDKSIFHSANLSNCLLSSSTNNLAPGRKYIKSVIQKHSNVTCYHFWTKKWTQKMLPHLNSEIFWSPGITDWKESTGTVGPRTPLKYYQNKTITINNHNNISKLIRGSTTFLNVNFNAGANEQKNNQYIPSEDLHSDTLTHKYKNYEKTTTLTNIGRHQVSSLSTPSSLFSKIILSKVPVSFPDTSIASWRNLWNNRYSEKHLLNRTVRSHREDMPAEATQQPDVAYGTLLIRQLTRTDGGNFHCRVDFREAPTRHSQAHLTVIVPPSSLDIRGPAGMRVSGLVGPFALGDAIQLECSATGGSPVPTVTWWLDDELIDDLSEERGLDAVTNNLTLDGLTRQHLLRDLTCKAANSNLTEELQATVTIDMKLPPLNVHILGSNEGVRDGRLHKLSCSSEGSRPPAVLTWWARTKQLSQASYTETPENSRSSSTLHLLASASDDGMHVSCRATNTLLGPAFALEDSVRITVLYPPQVLLKLSPLLNISNIDEHDDVFLDCVVKANPPVTQIKWKHNGVEVAADPSRGIVHSNMSLVLQRVNRRSSGAYTCTAFNKLGSAVSAELMLSVKFIPVCRGPHQSLRSDHNINMMDGLLSATRNWNHQKVSASAVVDDTGAVSTLEGGDARGSDSGESAQVYGTGVGVPVNITCSVDAHPEPHTFTWSLNTTNQEQVGDTTGRRRDESLSGNRGTHSSTRNPSSTKNPGSSSNVLTYTPHTSHEFGTLLCWAQNDVGKQTDPCVFQVVPASAPASAHNCTVSPTAPSSPNTLVLRCLKGWDGGLEQTFTLKVKEGKNFTTKRRDSDNSNRESVGNAEEWISGGAVQYIKDQRQPHSGQSVTGGRNRGTEVLERGVLAVLAGQSSPHFTVSGLAAGQEYILEVYSSNARGDSAPLLVNYVTPIDVAEGRLSSDTAYVSSGDGSRSGLVVLSVVMAVILVFGGLMAAAVILFVKRKREHQLRRDDHPEEERYLRSTTLVSAEDSTLETAELHVDHEQQSAQRPNINTAAANYSDAMPPDVKKPMAVNNSLLPTITDTRRAISSNFSNARGPTQRERIVRTVPHEPPDPDILLYRLKSSDV